eukprot:gnl/TRDRNA2_/TRDRNA2_36717_c0_seq1.p1 gnl/TRDRNA2_/TRDRNA2_36717_c0~~gnl/TRDRNA2_/TRDRNA2_36717_c0_seq1.p1  ORF type:complete len:292 (-),score=54.83 gnl/TRDRNA2_/TRDRNA2_36717_c0_seq1:85-960(-)
MAPLTVNCVALLSLAGATDLGDLCPARATEFDDFYLSRATDLDDSVLLQKGSHLVQRKAKEHNPSQSSVIPRFPAPPIPCRDDFATVAEKYFRKTGKAAEVGVFQGNFSEKNLHNWLGTYYMIDAWSYRSDGSTDKNFVDSATNDANMQLSEQRTSFAAERRHLIKGLSADVANDFDDGTLDWIYIDALHTHDSLLEDLRNWYPKVRPGGLLSGDDYGDANDTEMMTVERWKSADAQDQTSDVVKTGPENNQWGVISATRDFANEKGLELHVSWKNDCYNFNAWYFMKPYE